MDALRFWKETQKYSIVRDENWQGPSARGGPRHDAQMSEADTSTLETETKDRVNSTANSSSVLWDRLSASIGSGPHGAAVVRLMQRHLLEHVERLSLDEIELMARRQ